MEELQSTDVLDREILEDARKKAKRALAAAEDAIAAGAKTWDKKADKDIGELKRNFAVRVEKARAELMARLPLDKRRAHSEKVEALLVSAMQEYLGGLAREKILSLLEGALRRCAAGLTETDSGPLEAGCRALSQEELAALLDAALPGKEWSFQKNMEFHQIPGSLPALIVNSPDARITASVDLLAASLMEDSRAELVSALLGPEALLGPQALLGPEALPGGL
jgi:vacuolar-type H+-ATPase subunit E/Vma4